MYKIDQPLWKILFLTLRWKNYFIHIHQFKEHCPVSTLVLISSCFGFTVYVYMSFYPCIIFTFSTSVANFDWMCFSNMCIFICLYKYLSCLDFIKKWMWVYIYIYTYAYISVCVYSAVLVKKKKKKTSCYALWFL